jgi:3-oxoacyl-(acyl-carrier-protein) synthase
MRGPLQHNAERMICGFLGAAAACGFLAVRITSTSTDTSRREVLMRSFVAAGMLAPDGRCKTLDAGADGYVRGEAAAALLLQAFWPTGGSSRRHRSSEAATADQQLPAAAAVAILAGTAVNQDGRSSSLTAPNGPAQQAVVRAALAEAGIPAAAVRALQMHGTGTPLGDPIEVGSAAAVLDPPPNSTGPATAATVTPDGRRSPGRQLDQHVFSPVPMLVPVNLAADKSGVGHTEPAAGVMGILHAAWAVRAACSLPVLHLRQPNPYLAETLASASTNSTGGGLALPRQPAARPDIPASEATVAGAPSPSRAPTRTCCCRPPPPAQQMQRRWRRRRSPPRPLR